jgi:hypothetical protein
VYLYAISVVLDCFALLQAVKQYLETVIQVRAHILIIYIYAQLEVLVKVSTSQWTLQKKGTLILLNGFGLRQ